MALARLLITAAWLLVNAAYVLVGTVVTHLQLLKGIGSRWLVIDVGVPLAITLIVVGGGAFVLRYRDGAAHAPLFGLVWAVALMAAASAAALLVVPETRRWMGQLHKKTHLSASARES